MNKKLCISLIFLIIFAFSLFLTVKLILISQRSGIYIETEHTASEEELMTPGSSDISAGSFPKNVLININTASSVQLAYLPGIGKSTADNIIDYRNKNGGFKSPEEIKNVPGISEKMYENIKDFICISNSVED